ncbi:MAG: aminotransferase [Pseudomonadota bacterium]
MYIEPFKVEIWMNEWETRCSLNLAETCVESLTIEELLKLTGQNADLNGLLDLKMTYGAIAGSERLRAAIAALYEDPKAITVTHGTIAANMLAHRTILSPGDHVVAVVPTYQQHYSIPDSLGAEVTLLRLRAEDRYLPDTDTLRALVRPSTRLIALTNPNNPTGALIDQTGLEEIAAIAREVGAYVLCDEVYRGTDQAGQGSTKSMADIYERGLSTGSVSKAFSLAGLRLGWIAGPPDVAEAAALHRDYDTISVGLLNDHFATLALENADKVLARSRSITRGNLLMLKNWVADEPRVSWVQPNAGTTAMMRVEVPMPSRAFCIHVLEETGVMLTPGDAFDMEGYVRVGYANNPEILAEGLARLSEVLKAI